MGAKWAGLVGLIGCGVGAAVLLSAICWDGYVGNTGNVGEELLGRDGCSLFPASAAGSLAGSVLPADVALWLGVAHVCDCRRHCADRHLGPAWKTGCRRSHSSLESR